MENEVEYILKKYLEKQFAVDICYIQHDSCIDDDLKIIAADAIDLILWYSKKFNVDVSNFMAAEYFEPEGMNWLIPRTIPNKKKLLFKHLLKGIAAGRLDETVINSTI
ncbi:hypothetical protein GCM10023093_21330 [Nemorincola caseinilytica]|uniref:DUF1493 family protein n=1 Tax=Nemorincola caseinilytica TaxID=2054315 RepID=A0ABP8NJV5_9BACT